MWSAPPDGSLDREYRVLDSRGAEDCSPADAYRIDADWRKESPEGELRRRTAEFEMEVRR